MQESRLWFWHVVSGMFLLALLGLHTIVMHFDTILAWLGLYSPAAWEAASKPVGALNYAHGVMPRMQSLSMTVVYVLLAIFGLYHGVYGLRSILWELKVPRAVKRVAGTVLAVVCVGLIAYGVMTVIQGHINANAAHSPARPATPAVR